MTNKKLPEPGDYIRSTVSLEVERVISLKIERKINDENIEELVCWGGKRITFPSFRNTWEVVEIKTK